MKRLFVLISRLTILFIILSSCSNRNATLPVKMQLPVSWKFRMGDSLEWTKPKYDDRKWEHRSVEKISFKTPGYACYRLNIRFSDSLHMAVRKLGILKLTLGSPDDVAQIYINGKLFSQFGTIAPVFKSAWGVPIEVYLKEKDVKWNDDNTIAVRVYSPDTIGGGLFSGPYCAESINILTLFKQIFSYEKSDFVLKNDSFSTEIFISNRIPFTTYGSLIVEVMDSSQKTICKQQATIINDSLKFEKTYSFRFKAQHGKDYFLRYTIRDDFTGVSITKSQGYISFTDCPYPQSEVFSGIKFNGKFESYENADTWYPSWASDDELYSPYADGKVKGVNVFCTWSGSNKFFAPLGKGDSENPNYETETGNVVLSGNDPFHLKITPLEPVKHSNKMFHGTYPCGNLFYNGIWYYGRYLCHRWRNTHNEEIAYELGPFLGFRTSGDKGKTWQDPGFDDNNNLFPERGRCMGEKPIKLGMPHFVDFGKNMEYSPDGYAYLIGHGTEDINGVVNWCSGDAIFMARVKPSVETINNSASYEYYAGTNKENQPLWSKSFGDIKPIISWKGHCGVCHMTYHSVLKKYFCMMCVGPYDGNYGDYDYWIAESDSPWGPWKKVAYLEKFGSQGYFMTMPSKFNNSKDKLILFWSADWAEGYKSDPPGSRYGLCVGEFDINFVKL